jgi:hypothetical protein
MSIRDALPIVCAGLLGAALLLSGCQGPEPRHLVVAEKGGQWMLDIVPAPVDPGAEPAWVSPQPFKLEKGRKYWFQSGKAGAPVVLVIAEPRAAK